MVKKKIPLKPQTIVTASQLPRAIVGVGASAGGLEAITELLENLPERTGMAFVYVQHLDPNHKSLLVPILSQIARIPVEQAKQGMKVLADHLYVIPPGKNLLIKGGSLRLASRVGDEERMITIDNFFRSLAADQKNRSLGIILSGNASDGALGLGAIKNEGGITFAQDIKSAKHSSMPHQAIESGVVDYVLRPSDIARELGRISRHPYITSLPRAPLAIPESANNKGGESLQKVFALLQTKSGVNFFHYKIATLRRRISRRMVLHKIGKLANYLSYLERNPSEIDALFQDILINVTQYFRDHETFGYLKGHVFPAIMREHLGNEPIRIWSAGCSTGEEAYSLAMSLVEYMDVAKKNIPFQIFGSDLNEVNVRKARQGLYPLSIARDVSPERLRRFFVQVEGQYQISKAIRDMCIFSKHDLISSPPFSQLDLIACRNVLIYLEPLAQKRILPVFFYALKPTGFLCLGKSEGIGEYTDLFLAKDKNHKIFTKKVLSNSRHLKNLLHENSNAGTYNLANPEKIKNQNNNPLLSPGSEDDLSKDVEQILLSPGFVHPCVVVDETLQIVQFRGQLTPYLNFPEGKATWNLLKMASGNLLLDLREGINEAKKHNIIVLRSAMVTPGDGRSLAVKIEIIPLKRHSRSGRHLLVVFRPAGESVFLPEDENDPPSGTKKPGGRQVQRLERQLSITKEHLRIALQDEKNAREEFQSANEEMVSSNEELQSTNEELETAKEELQSTNEELVTVNEELQTRNVELSQINNDLTNVLSSVNVPIIIVDRELRIRRITPIAEKSLKIIPADLGRSINDIKLPIRFPDLPKLLLDVIHNAQPRHQEVEDEAGHWYTLWVRPYQTWDNKIDGAVITLIDVNDIKLALEKLEQSLSYTQGILGTMREPLLVLDKTLRIKTANASFFTMFLMTPKDTVGKFVYELNNHRWDTPELREALEEILPKKSSFHDLEITFKFSNLKPKVMLFNGQRLLQREGGGELILLSMQDITEQRVLQQRNDSFMSMASHELKTPVATIKTLVQILQKRFEESPDRMLTEYLTRMDQQIIQLTKLVTDLLDVSKIKADKFELEKKVFDLDQLAQEIVKSCQFLSPQHAIVIQGKTDAKIKGDRSSISRVFINLIVNAIKYSLNADRIIITLSGSEKEVCVGVQDFGIGIAKADQGKIFTRFFQVNNDSGQNFSGLGIGLYISEAIVAQHHGHIWVESKEGKGSTFYFALPIYKVKVKKHV